VSITRSIYPQEQDILNNQQWIGDKPDVLRWFHLVRGECCELSREGDPPLPVPAQPFAGRAILQRLAELKQRAKCAIYERDNRPPDNTVEYLRLQALFIAQRDTINDLLRDGRMTRGDLEARGFWFGHLKCSRFFGSLEEIRAATTLLGDAIKLLNDDPGAFREQTQRLELEKRLEETRKVREREYARRASREIVTHEVKPCVAPF
jgi:hypothetical protein